MPDEDFHAFGMSFNLIPPLHNRHRRTGDKFMLGEDGVDV